MGQTGNGIGILKDNKTLKLYQKKKKRTKWISRNKNIATDFLKINSIGRRLTTEEN